MRDLATDDPYDLGAKLAGLASLPSSTGTPADNTSNTRLVPAPPVAARVPVAMNVRIDGQLHKRLKLAAVEDDRVLYEIVEEALAQWLDRRGS